MIGQGQMFILWFRVLANLEALKQASVGDSICLLEGCTVPVILRPCGGGYKLIGEAFVHGIMKGEFWKDQHKSSMQVFHLK